LLGGLWAFPSGRRLPDETNEAALKRAVREKLGLDIEIQRKVGTVRHEYSHYRITLHGFLCEPARGALPSGEGADWILPGESSALALPRADRKLIERWIGKETR
jgi:A/G-specific adenine glycosylase